MYRYPCVERQFGEQIRELVGEIQRAKLEKAEVAAFARRITSSKSTHEQLASRGFGGSESVSVLQDAQRRLHPSGCPSYPNNGSGLEFQGRCQFQE